MTANISEKSKPTERVQRAEVTEDLGMLEALDKYIESIPELAPIAEEMKAKAQKLEKELENKEDIK